MLDNRPLSEQYYADVRALLHQRIGENLTLDYKRELSTKSDRDRAELCKDISALANALGGMILYGVDEDSTDRAPQVPPSGTARMVGRQSVEEWASQVLRSGVQPPLDFEMETFDYGGAPDSCVLVVRTNASPSAPHMVTLKADNRYYGRFYRRSNYESRIAEEYEVREMLERARRLYQGVEDELARRGYSDPYSPDFGNNPYTRPLATRDAGFGTERALPGMWAAFTLVPTAPATVRQDRADWLSWLDPNQRKYEPETGSLFVPFDIRRPVLGGISCAKRDYVDGSPTGLDEEYLLTGFDGSVELGFSPARIRSASQRIYFGGKLVRRLWQTLNFAAEVRSRLGILAPHLLAVNLRNTEGAVLAGFASRWTDQDPIGGAWVDFDEAPKCLEPNVQIRREFTAQDFEEVVGAGSTPPQQMRELADDVCSAFGIENPVLFNG